MEKQKTTSKLLMKFIFIQMNKLDENKISIEKARAQANLIKQANILFKYELDKAQLSTKTLMFLNRQGIDEIMDIKTLENE
jgi:hypothetical protein